MVIQYVQVQGHTHLDWNGHEAQPPFINKMKDHVKIWTKSTEKVKIHPQRPNPE